MQEVLPETPPVADTERLDPYVPIIGRIPSGLRLERGLTLEGNAFRLQFRDIRRENTTRGFNRHHDDRDHFPAWCWMGMIGILNRRSDNVIRCGFCTDVFWTGHVPDLKMSEIIFLMLIDRKLRMLRLSKSQRARMVDVIAYQALASYAYAVSKDIDAVKIHIAPLREEDPLFSVESTFDGLDPVPGSLLNP